MTIEPSVDHSHVENGAYWRMPPRMMRQDWQGRFGQWRDRLVFAVDTPGFGLSDTFPVTPVEDLRDES